MFTDDEYLAETARLLGAIQLSVHIESTAGRSFTMASPNQERKLATSEKQQVKKLQRQACSWFETTKQGKLAYVCCNQCCMTQFKCSKQTGDNIPLIQWYRNKFLDFSRETKRMFLAARIKSKKSEIGVATTLFLLETVEVMNYYLSQGMIPMQPDCASQQMISVCNAFYRFVFQVSQNKLYQPTVPEREFSTVMNIPRSPHLHDFSADDSVKGWLVNYAQAHLHDPGKDHII